MDIRRSPELLDQLAAQYVLGTLRGAARARFRRWMREDAAVARAVLAWEDRLAPMAVAVRPVTPPRRVWDGIAERIAPATRPAQAGGLWNSIAFWRALGLLTSGTAAALLASVVLLRPEAPAPAPVVQVVRASATVPEAYFAVLTDARTHKPVLMLAATRHSDELVVQRLEDGIVVPQRSLELWALPAGGGAPRSLGLVASQARHSVKLKASADRTLGEIPMLAVSLEPAGGSPSGAPTGPVLYTGPCIRYW